jgi:hypothetical protein
MLAPLGIKKRYQMDSEKLPHEWRENKNFSMAFERKHLKNAQIINTSLLWTQLTTPPNPIVQTTKEQAAELEQQLPLLQGIPKDIISKDERRVQPLTIFLSADERPERLAVYIRGGLTLPESNRDPQPIIEEAITKYIQLAKPTTPRGDPRHQEQANRAAREGKPWGVYHLGLWHAQGHGSMGQAPVLSRDVMRSAKGFSATLAFYKDIAPLVQVIGRLFQEVDPQAYEEYKANHKRQCRETPELEMLRVSNRTCFHCIAVLVNAQVGPHKDSNDVLRGWVAMACFGDFKGGELCLPSLGYRIPFQPGDVVLFRSAVLEHWVAPFKGTRYSCVFFTKQNLWKPFA